MSGKLARRLVVTGHDGQGRSRVASDTVLSGQKSPGSPGQEFNSIWGSDTKMHFPDSGEPPKFTSFFPPLDGFRLIELYIPGQNEATDDGPPPDNVVAALEAVAPGLVAAMDPDRPGMHRTSSIDFIIVTHGQCVLQLEYGEVALKTGDIVVENGTMHAWLNPHDEPCRFVAVVVGARNDLCA